jgi:hypothetical protein
VLVFGLRFSNLMLELEWTIEKTLVDFQRREFNNDISPMEELLVRV